MEGRCPECGQPIWPSVLRWLDPERDRLPLLDHPHRVAKRLVCMADGFTLLAVLAVVVLVWQASSQVAFGTSLEFLMQSAGTWSQVGVTVVPLLMLLWSLGLGKIDTLWAGRFGCSVWVWSALPLATVRGLSLIHI